MQAIIWLYCTTNLCSTYQSPLTTLMVNTAHQSLVNLLITPAQHSCLSQLFITAAHHYYSSISAHQLCSSLLVILFCSLILLVKLVNLLINFWSICSLLLLNIVSHHSYSSLFLIIASQVSLHIKFSHHCWSSSSICSCTHHCTPHHTQLLNK